MVFLLLEPKNSRILFCSTLRLKLVTCHASGRGRPGGVLIIASIVVVVIVVVIVLLVNLDFISSGKSHLSPFFCYLLCV
jgi:hypothetical protein